MIYRYIYKITCTKGSFKDKFYYGRHTTNNLNDGYKGSGKLLLNYYKKFPNDYKKEIISYHNSEEELNKAEYDIINMYINDPMCLNIAAGGHGGFTGKHTNETKEKMRGPRPNVIPWNKGLKNCYSEEVTNKMKEAWKHRTVSDITKERMKEAAKHRPPVSEYTKKKHSIASKNNKASLDHKWMTNGNNIICPHISKSDYYLIIGYHF